MVFPRLSLARYHYLHKNRVYNNLNLRYSMSSIIEGGIQLLRYHTRPYIWILPPLLFTLVQFW